MPPRRRVTRRNPDPQPETPETPLNATTIEEMIAQRVADALATYETNRNNTTGISGGGSRNNDIPGNHQRICTYKDFMNCKPKPFNGSEGVVGLCRWIEKMESVFHISFCAEDCRVKFATCTFVDRALSWWNDNVKTIGIDTAYNLTWEELKQMLTEEYCPRNEMQKLEQELWNLTMKGSDITTYTNRFNDLSTMCPGLVTPEYKKIERYIWGLAPSVQGMVTASRPTTYDSAKQLAYRLVDQNTRQGSMVEKVEDIRDIDGKRKFDSESRGGNEESSWKKQNVGRAYATTTPAPKQYNGNLPKCNKCNYHHLGACKELNCYLCNKKGHTASSCRSQPTTTTNQGTDSGGNAGCFECGNVGHYRRNCPKLRRQGENARGRVFLIGRQEAREEPEVVTGTFLLNNLYASKFIDSGANRSVISLNFKRRINQPTHIYSMKPLYLITQTKFRDEISLTRGECDNCQNSG